MALTPDNLPLLSRLAALNDLVRLRMLRLLKREELSVGELARALQLPQSTVSRHLKLLHDGGWAMKRTEGTASLYRVDEHSLDPASRDLWKLVEAQIGSTPTFDEDDARVAEVIADRRTDSRAFFGRVAGEWDHLRRELFGERFTADALLTLLPADWVVADLGCGTGNASEFIAPVVKRVIAVDREPAMLEAARQHLAGFDNVEFRQGELTDLPLQDKEVDVAMIFLVLHHVPQPQQAMIEVARVVKPGGIVLIVDMMRHDRESYRHTMGHQHLGFEERDVHAWAKSARLGDVRFRRLRPDTDSKGPGLFAATMRK